MTWITGCRQKQGYLKMPLKLVKAQKCMSESITSNASMNCYENSETSLGNKKPLRRVVVFPVDFKIPHLLFGISLYASVLNYVGMQV